MNHIKNVSLVISLYKDGCSMAQISKEVGSTEYHIKQLLVESGHFRTRKKRPKVGVRTFESYFDKHELNELRPILKTCHFAGYRVIR